jgi:integrase
MVTVTPKGNRWRVEIYFRWPDGAPYRKRLLAPEASKSAAQRWALHREQHILTQGRAATEPKVEIPTLAEFFPRFVGHGEGEGQKPSSLDAKRSVFRKHLGPAFGSVKLDRITDEKVSGLRTSLVRLGRAPKTINNVLSPLNACLKLAVKWRILPAMPCTIEIPPVNDTRPGFYDEDDFAQLCEGARKVGPREHLMVRLGGDAGLRRGEMMALRWVDVDFRRGQLRIEQAAWKRSRRQATTAGSAEWCVGKPKGGRGRVVPMTDALREALQGYRHLRGEFVLCQDSGAMAPGHMLRTWLQAAQRRAGLEVSGALHKLRHTFCSHLAMRGAPVKAIQELAGHADLSMTLRYMHLSPGARDSAIALLNFRGTPMARAGSETATSGNCS